MNFHAVGYRVVAALALSLTLHVVPVQAQGPNLLVDPGFENNPLESAHNVLNYFEQYQGFWGPEEGSIVSQIGPVIPPEGTKMLQMRDDGGVTTAVFQVTDVRNYATLIDSGEATVWLSSHFDADPGIPAAVGVVLIQFYALPDWYSYHTNIGTALTLDADPATWEEVAVSGIVPSGTRWILTQIYFSNGPLRGLPAYIDAANLTISGSGGGLQLLAEGSCPAGGPLRISWFGATPDGWVVLMHALNEGVVTIPPIYPCRGTVLGLGSQRIPTVWQGPTGRTGSGSIAATAGPRACGTYLQLLDLAECETTNVAPIE